MTDALAHLVALFPRAFYFAGRERRPLKVGISNDLFAAKTDLSNTEIHRALAAYTNSIGYLSKMLEGAPRVDLNGEPAGAVTADEARHAWSKMQKLVEARNAAAEAQSNDRKAPWRAPVAQAQAPPRPSPSPSARPVGAPTRPKRLGLTDLKQAWLARQAKAAAS